MVRNDWITADDLENPDYLIGADDDAPVESAKPTTVVAADLVERAEKVKADNGSYADRAAVMRDAADAGVPQSDLDALAAILVQKAGFTKKNANTIVKERHAFNRQAEKAKNITSKAGGGRVQILTSEDHSAAIAKTWAAIVAHHAQRPRMFNGAGGIVRLRHDPVTESIELQSVDRKIMQHEARKAVSFLEAKDSGVTEVVVPGEVADDLLSHETNGLNVLRNVVRIPFFAPGPDGRLTLVATPGYHAPTGYYYQPVKDFNMKPVPEKPSADDLARAKDLLLGNVFRDFPFADDATGGKASRNHALAMLLLPFMREAVAGPTPIHFVSKPMPGTGGGLLVDTIMLISTGREGEAQTDAKSDEERRKNVTATFRSGQPYLWIDNINGLLDSAAYASLATSEWWTDRILGGSVKGSFPNRLLLIFVGNNVKTSHEITRRCLPIFLDAKGNPIKGRTFKHDNLKAWVRANRADLVWACLTLIQAWVAAGEPKDPSDPLPSFEAWSAVFRGLLTTIGEDGFLGNLGQLHDTANEELDAWGTLATVWVNTSGVGVKRPIGDPEKHGSGSAEWDGENSLLSLIDRYDIPIAVRGESVRARKQSFAGQLAKKRGNVFAVTAGGKAMDVVLRLERDTSANGNLYVLEEVTPTTR